MPGLDEIKPYRGGNPAEPDPPKGGAKRLSLDSVKPYYASRDVLGGMQTQQNPQEFDFQLKTGANNELLRAQDQGFWETAGIKAANFIPNVLTGIGEMVGYGGTLASEWGKDDKDYSNGLTKLMQSWKNPFGEIYRENPNQTFDLTDSAWWIDNVGSLLESATQFAIPATGIGKLFGGMAKAASGAVGAGRAGMLGADALAQTGTAATLAYAEGAMSGYSVYEKAYNKQYQDGILNGMKPLEAHARAAQIASDAASTTVQMNTMMNTMLNMTALAPMFKRSEDEIMQFYRGRKGALPGEESAAYRARLTQEATEAGLFKNRHGLSSYASEAAQEGLEEINTQYAEKEGMRVGAGKKKNVIDALTQFGTAVDDVTDQEGALNFILGAFGGMAQTVALDNIPMHRVPGAAEGAKTKTFISSRTRNADNTRRYFDNIADALAKDVDVQEKKTAQLAAAIAKGDEVEAEIIRNDMFDVLGLSAVQMGLGDQWINTFKEMAGTSNEVDRTSMQEQLDMLNEQIAQAQTPEEQAALNQSKAKLVQSFDNQTTPAMQKGLAMNANDNSYKVRAAQAIEDIKAYQRMHDQIYSKYNSDEEMHAGLPDYIYGNAANLYRQEKIHERETAKIEAAEAEDMLRFAGTTTRTDEMVKRAAGEAKATIEMHENIIKRIKEDQNEFNNAIAKNDPAAIERILAKHKVLGQLGTPQIKALGDRMVKQLENAAKVIKETEDKARQSTGFTQWLEDPKNTGKTINDYFKLMGDRYSSNATIRRAKESLAILATNIEENRARLNELTANPNNIRKTLAKMKEATDARDKAAAETYQKSELAKNLERTAAQAHVDQNNNVLQGQERMLHIKIKEINEQLVRSTEQLAERNKRINDLKLTQHSIWNVKWHAKLQIALADAKALAREITQLEAQRADLLKQLGINQEVQEDTAEEQADAQQAGEQAEATTTTAVVKTTPTGETTEQGGTLEEIFGEEPGTGGKQSFSDAVMQSEVASVEKARQAELEALPGVQRDREYIEMFKDLSAYGATVEEAIANLKAEIQKLSAVNQQLPAKGAPDELARLKALLKFVTPHIADEADKGKNVPVQEYIDSMQTVLDTYLKSRKKNSNAGKINAKYDEKLALIVKQHAVQKTTKHDQTADPILIAANRYTAHLNRLPGQLHPAFSRYEEDLKMGMPFNAEAFLAQDEVRDALEMGLAWRASVINALNLLNNYVSLLPKQETPKDQKTEKKQEEDEEAQDKRTAEEQWDAETEKEKLSQPTVGMSDDPMTAEGPDVVENKDKIHENKKAEDILKLNFSSLEYENFINKRGNWSIAGSKLNPKLPAQIVDPQSLLPGTILTAALDTSFNDKVKVHGTVGEYKDMTYDDYIDKEGNVTDINDVPIKLVAPDGTTVGYLPTVSWLLERLPGTYAKGEGYRNIVAIKEGVNPDGTVYEIDNLAIQYKALLELRQLIVSTKQIDVAVKEKGPGTVILNMVKTGDYYKPMKGRALSKGKPDSSMLPDKNLKFGTVLHGVVYIGKEEPFQGKINNSDLALYHNAPVVILPMADGSYSVSPLYMPELDDAATNNQAHATIERAMWLYLKAGDQAVDAELDQAFQATGFNFRNAADLRRFINQQFTYMNKFDSHNTALNPDKSPRFLFNITNPTDGKATIMVGWENSGEPKIIANLATGGKTIDQRFMAALREGLASRQRNVNFTRQGIRGINSRGQFNEHYFSGKEWKTTTHENYNEYVKSYATTYVYGRNQIGDKYVYGANPMITLDRSTAVVKLDPAVPIDPVLIVEPSGDEAPTSAPLSSDSYDELASSMGYDNWAMPKDNIPTSLQPSENMQLITLNLLKEIHNFTSPARHNGKTVEQVYEELLASGVPYLDEGHNPFLNCT